MTSRPKGTIQSSRVEDSVADSISMPESTQKQLIPTHLVGIPEAGTVLEDVPAGAASARLTSKRATVSDGHECAIDHSESESQASLEDWCQFSQVQGETKLPVEGQRLCVEIR